MIYTLLAYFDVDTEKFNPPMVFPFEKEAAVETIREGVIKGKIEGAEAYELYFLGTYDTADAKFDLLLKPSKELTLKQYVRKEKSTA